MLEIKNVNINLKDTITCGQIFRYTLEDDNSYTVVLSDRVINVYQKGNNLYIKSNIEDNLENIIRKYFDLDRNYDDFIKNLELDENIREMCNFCAGFKIINQSAFECIISYIISANNGVPQIRNAVNNIAEKYGEKVLFEGKEYYLFPNYKRLKNVTVEDYRNLKVGFRDKYIYEFVQRVNNGEFNIDDINNMNSDDAMEYLMTNKGIGEKVSSCILLFSYSRLDVFPIDTWVKKYMKDMYNVEGVGNIKTFTKDKYKDYTGLIIQYMFHYKRNKE